MRSSRTGALLIFAALALAGVAPGSEDGARATAAPTITATAPVADATGHALDAPLDVWFDEAMNASSVAPQILPAVALAPSWPTPDHLQLTPTPAFTNCTVYSIVVRGNDSDEGLALAPGPVPNPWSFMTSCDRPHIVRTDPADGARNVRPDANLVITFSEAMDCLSLGLQLNRSLNPPGSWLASCDPSHTVWTVRLTFGTTFETGVSYTATVTDGVSNDTGDPLVSSTVPNPWVFRVNAPPTVSGPTLSASGCLDARMVVVVSWTMSDREDAATALTVLLTFENTSGTETIFGPASGLPSPASYGWTLPAADVTTRVRLEVTDTAGATVSSESDPPFRIDGGPPRVVSTTPSAPNNRDLPTNTSFTIVFSEPMNRTTTQGAISSVPTLPGPLQYNWTAGDSALTVRPSPLPYDTLIEITVARSATDTCAPGRPMLADTVFDFRTVPPNPSAPRSLIASSYGETSVSLRWDRVTTYVNLDPILPPATVLYRVFRGNETSLGSPIAETTSLEFTDRNVSAASTYWYRVQAVVGSRGSTPTAPLRVHTLAPFLERPEGQVSVFAALAAVGVAAVLGAQMRYRRKRREAEAQLEAEIREIVELVRQVRTESDPERRRQEEAALQDHFRVLVHGEDTDEGFRADPRLEGLYRALAQVLVRSPEVNVGRGRASVDERLGDLAPRLREHGAAYRLLSEAEASVQSELFPTLPASARKALLLVYFYGLEEYLNNRLRGLVPVGATVLLGERGHINVRRRGWEAQWASLSLGNLLYMLDHNTHFFVADVDRWEKEVEPLLRQAVEARNRTAHPSREAPPLVRVQDLVFGAFPAIESILKWPKGPSAI